MVKIRYIDKSGNKYFFVLENLSNELVSLCPKYVYIPLTSKKTCLFLPCLDDCITNPEDFLKCEIYKSRNEINK
jgi:hypothetical protein